ncbi:unnamed protein product [Sphagnum compactum]
MDPSVNATLETAFTGYPLGASVALVLVVAAASSIIDVTQSRERLSSDGIILIIGPNRRENQFKYEQRPATSDYTPPAGTLDSASDRYVLPLVPFPGQSDRHSQYNNVNNASSMISTNSENNISVAVRYARPQSNLVSWLVIVERIHAAA